MSGPITVVVTANPIAAVLAAAAIQAASAVRAGYESAAEISAEHAAGRKANREAQAAAREQGREATAAAIDAAEHRFDALLTLAGQLGMTEQVESVRPARPPGTEANSLAEYAATLDALAERVESILVAAAARAKSNLEEPPTDLALPEARKSLVERLLERIAHLGAVPENIATLARQLEATLPGPQAELLASELRRAVQLRLEAAETERVQLATATIVEQTLKDLGYQVEEIQHTLFVEGGMAHFRRAGWGDYMVRLRVDAAANTINFNVVRAVAAGDNERSVLDHLAEDRWCAEFPALLRALEARGVHLDVTRRLEAGELPVQLVERTRLPAFADEAASRPRAQPKAREIK